MFEHHKQGKKHLKLAGKYSSQENEQQTKQIVKLKTIAYLEAWILKLATLLQS